MCEHDIGLIWYWRNSTRIWKNTKHPRGLEFSASAASRRSSTSSISYDNTYPFSVCFEDTKIRSVTWHIYSDLSRVCVQHQTLIKALLFVVEYGDGWKFILQTVAKKFNPKEHYVLDSFDELRVFCDWNGQFPLRTWAALRPINEYID